MKYCSQCTFYTLTNLPTKYLLSKNPILDLSARKTTQYLPVKIILLYKYLELNDLFLRTDPGIFIFRE